MLLKDQVFIARLGQYFRSHGTYGHCLMNCLLFIILYMKGPYGIVQYYFVSLDISSLNIKCLPTLCWGDIRQYYLLSLEDKL